MASATMRQVVETNARQMHEHAAAATAALEIAAVATVVAAAVAAAALIGLSTADVSYLVDRSQWANQHPDKLVR